MKAWLAFFVLASAPAVAAQPLVFATIGADTNVQSNSEITCAYNSLALCELRRTSLGNVPIESSMVFANNETGRAVGLHLKAKSFWIDAIKETLAAKYGPPVKDTTRNAINSQGGPYDIRTLDWPKFENNASLEVAQHGDVTFIIFKWPVNASPTLPPKVDF